MTSLPCHTRFLAGAFCILMLGVAACSGGPSETASYAIDDSSLPSSSLETGSSEVEMAGSRSERVAVTATTRYVDGDASRSRPDADVLYVKAEQEAETRWSFTVTIAHPDKSSEDFANGWDIMLPDGRILGRAEGERFTASIESPSVGEQPMDNLRSDVEIPADAPRVIVRAHDSQAGFGGREVSVVLDQSSGPGFEVLRTY